MESPFYGREVQMASLSAQLDRASSGVGSVVLVEGDAGIGKSRLLDEAAQMARRRLFRVGSCAADPGDRMVELSTLMVALFEGPEPILERSALSGLHSMLEQRYWLLQDLQELLEQAAVESPLLICLDDLQWTDGGTAAALRALPRRLATVPIVWVLAFRPILQSSPFGNVLDHLDQVKAEKISLEPLDEGSVRDITAGVLHAEPDADVMGMAARAGGNPFFLAEMLMGLREEQLIRIESGHAELVEARLPGRVGVNMRSRLDQLSDPAQEVAAVATALGRTFSFDDLASMLGQSPPALLAPVKEVLQAGLFQESDEKLAFRHDLVLEAVRASLPLSVSRSLDRQAAAVLLANGALPLEVSTRLAASAELGDEIAISTLSKAADALDMTDPGASADLSHRALELAPRNHPLRQALVAQTAIRLHAAGRIDAAKEFVDTALRQSLPPEAEADFRLIIAAMFAISPDVRADSCYEGLALPDLSAFLRMLFLTNLVHNLVVAGRPDEARQVLPEARAAVDEVERPCGYFVLELAESGLRYADGRFTEALELVKSAARNGEVCALDTGLSSQHWKIMQGRRFLTTQWLCEVLRLSDRFDDALQLSQERIATAQRERQAWALNIFETGRGRQLLEMGLLPDAAAALAERFTQDVAEDVVTALDAAGVVALGRVAIHIGDRRLARQASEIGHLMFDRGPPSVQRHAVWLFALQALANGHPLDAHHWLCALGQHERQLTLPRFPMDVADDVCLVRIALAVGDNELAMHAVDAARKRSHLNPGLHTLEAVFAHTAGLMAQNQEDLARAVTLYAMGPRPLALASALEDLGVVAVESGATEDGVDALDRALALYAEAGATWDAGRARGRLRSLGVRRRLVSTGRPERGWSALTDSEAAVARLVAEGLTNREVAERLFVSPHTVTGHLRHIFTKMGVKSRVDLARIAADLGPLP
jgi:DNA-binding CsgD family transcriptional regulator